MPQRESPRARTISARTIRRATSLPAQVVNTRRELPDTCAVRWDSADVRVVVTDLRAVPRPRQTGAQFVSRNAEASGLSPRCRPRPSLATNSLRTFTCPAKLPIQRSKFLTSAQQPSLRIFNRSRIGSRWFGFEPGSPFRICRPVQSSNAR